MGECKFLLKKSDWRQQQQSMDKQIAPKVSIQHNIKQQQRKKATEFLEGWAKSTKSRFGLKLYTFAPKKAAMGGMGRKQAEKEMESQATGPAKEEIRQQKQSLSEMNTPERKQGKERKMRTTYAKSDSDSSEYHPNKRAKVHRKRQEKARKKEGELVKQALF